MKVGKGAGKRWQRLVLLVRVVMRKRKTLMMAVCVFVCV
jgi:hypothetical protein